MRRRGRRFALEMIVANHDAVVTDLRITRLLGSTLITALLNSDIRPAIIVITGVTQQQELQRLKEREIEGIFTKPFDLEALDSEVRVIAERRRKLWHSSRC